MERSLTDPAYDALAAAEAAIGHLRWIIARIQSGEHHLLSKYEIAPILHEVNNIKNSMEA